MPNTVQKLQSYTKNTSFKPKVKVMFFLVPIFLIVYMFLLSPYIEPYIQEFLVNTARLSSTERFNSLSPVYATSEQNSSYSLSSIGDNSVLNDILSKTQYYVEDPRILAMSKFLDSYNSPMQPYAELFVSSADEYSLDWRLVASISGVESAFGNIIEHTGYYNAWGWRGGEGGSYSAFSSFAESIPYITQRLALGYGTDLSPFDIEPAYCPPCAANSAHSWANGVTRYMNELEYYLNNLEDL